MGLRRGQLLILRVELLLLALLHVERADHADTGQILPRRPEHAVQKQLDLAVFRHRDRHDPVDHQGQQRDRDDKDQRAFDIDRKRHDHRAEDDDGRAQEQAQGHVDPGLHLVDVTRHAGDQRGGSRAVHPCKIQFHDVIKHSLTQRGRRSDRRLCRKILCRDTHGKAHAGQQKQDQSHLQDVGHILVRDADIDDPGHDERHKKLEDRFKQLKARCQNRFLPVFLQILQ